MAPETKTRKKTKRPSGRPRVLDSAVLRRVRRMHDRGVSYTEIGRTLGVSRQCARMFGLAVNPESEPKRWICESCGGGFLSRARYRAPERCAICHASGPFRPGRERKKA